MIYKGSNAPTFVKDFDEGKREAVIAFATYNSLDSDQDIATKGMFTKSWSEHSNKIRFFQNHNTSMPLGKIKSFHEDDNHGYAVVEFSKSRNGEDAWIMAQEGVMQDASYGFSPIKSERIEGKGRKFLEVKLFEVSLLTHWGAHPQSGLVGIQKGVDNSVLNELTNHLTLLEKFVHNTKASDEVIKEQLQVIDNIKAVLNINTVATHVADEPTTSEIKMEDVQEFLKLLKS